MGLSNIRLLVVALALVTLVTGCSSTSSSSSSARVVDRNSAAAKRPVVTSGQYVVRPGDTLFSIAFRYGWDYKALAARNSIAQPYTIRPGQTIRFDEPGSTSSRVVSSTSPSSKTTVTRRPAGTPPPVKSTGTAATSPIVTPSTAPTQVPAAERSSGPTLPPPLKRDLGPWRNSRTNLGGSMRTLRVAHESLGVVSRTYAAAGWTPDQLSGEARGRSLGKGSWSDARLGATRTRRRRGCGCPTGGDSKRCPGPTSPGRTPL